jgi:hypothetical protein
MADIREDGWDEEGLGPVATLYRNLLEASDIGLGERIDAYAAWDVAHRAGWWERLRLRVNGSPRYLRLTLPAVGVALTLGVAGFLVTDAGSPQHAATPQLAPATTAVPSGGPTEAVAPPATTSAELASLAQPVLATALKPYWSQPITVKPFTAAELGGSGPGVYVALGIATTTQPAGPQNSEVTVDVTQEPDPASAVSRLHVDPTDAQPTSGTWPGGIGWAVAHGAQTAYAVRPDGVVVQVETSRQSLGGAALGPDLLHGQIQAVLEAISTKLPTRPKLAPPALPTWRSGADNAAVTALAAAARTAPDPAATAAILYIRTEEKSSSGDDVREWWVDAEGRPGFRYDTGTYAGKPLKGATVGEDVHADLAGEALTWSGVRGLPDTADELQQKVSQLYTPLPHAPKAVFDDLGNLLDVSPASPGLQAAVAAVLSRIPGAIVDPAATTVTGKLGVAISLGDKRLLFDPATGTLEETDFLTPSGAVSSTTTVQDVAAVSALRVRPDGTEAPAK